MEENKPFFQSVWKITGMLAQEKERAIKKALMMSRWISKAETKEIENSYEVFSGAIKRVGEDFSWLAETLAALARDIQWDPKAIEKISAHPPAPLRTSSMMKPYFPLCAPAWPTPNISGS